MNLNERKIKEFSIVNVIMATYHIIFITDAIPNIIANIKLISFMSSVHTKQENFFLVMCYLLISILIINIAIILCLNKSKERKEFIMYFGIFLLLSINASLSIIANDISEFEYIIHYIVLYLCFMLCVYSFSEAYSKKKSKIITFGRFYYSLVVAILTYSFTINFLYSGPDILPSFMPQFSPYDIFFVTIEGTLSSHFQHLALMLLMLLVTSVTLPFIFVVAKKGYSNFISAVFILSFILIIVFYIQNSNLIVLI